MNYEVEVLQPFGAIIRSKHGNDSIKQFSREDIQSFVSTYKLIVFKGYDTLPKQELALFAQKLGKPLQWVFGAINDLKVKQDAENYIFTDHEVPMHWDGAFVGTIPHIILFQCIVAPRKEDMGGTTFCDTEGLLENQSKQTIQQWSQIEITYTTQKIVHYGGKISQQLIAPHEVEKERKVMRYAEPVDDLNPVKLEIRNLTSQTDEVFVQTMKEQLYHPDHLYTHRWEAGDIVLADNHVLLHGREAFLNPNERYIQRINLLHRPAGFSIKRFIDNCLTIRRKEFFVAELPIFLIALLLNITSLQRFAEPSLYLGLAAIIMLFNIGDMINCYADYELDSVYKSHLSNAVYELGKKNVMLQIALSGILGLSFTIIVAIQTQQLFLIPLTIIGAIIGLQYSVKPFKFKSGGPWQLLCLWGIIFFGPMLYTAIITNGFPDLLQLLIFSFYGFHQMGIILLNTAEDYTEDKATGLRTIIIYLGLHRAMNFAYYLVIFSGIMLQVCMAYLLWQYHANLLLYSSIGIFTIGWLKIINEYKIIIDKINKLKEEDAVKEIKKNGMKVPRWLKIGAYGFLSVVLIYTIHRLIYS
jgi:alpha-ketoglutarate-dependent taurine dioxygenase/4-hydroxybenzoate polyprenyltransferase